MKTIGYARTSTADQVAGLESQLRDLEAAGCCRIYQEQTSAKEGSRRPELERALDYLRDEDGDVFVVTKLSRLARSLRDALDIEARIAAKDAHLKILEMGIDTSTPAGRLTGLWPLRRCPRAAVRA